MKTEDRNLNKNTKPQLKVVSSTQTEDFEFVSDHDNMDYGSSKKSDEGEGPWLISYADLMTLLMGFFALIASMSTPDVNRLEKVQESVTEQFGGEFKKPYEDLAKKIENIVKKNNLENQIKVTRAADGVTIKFDGTLFFNSGEFVVKEQGRFVIDKLLGALAVEIPAYKTLIEGHTDNNPISHNIIASNWELSGIRAARIAQIFETYGFKKEQLTIMGWGETKPEVPNSDSSGINIPKNQAKNRRVLIKIYNE